MASIHWLTLGTALLLALGIMAIGTQYIVSPRAAASTFGLPLPEGGTNIPWWLRLKGVRDIVAGLVVLTFMTWGRPRDVGMVLLAEAVIPIGDMSLILAAKGSTGRALGMHGATAVVMVITGLALISGVL